METISIFNFDDYKRYLKEFILSLPNHGRGLKGQWADLLQVKSSFISQVLNGHLQFSPEQGLLIGEQIGLSREEIHIFILMIQKERAGTHSLKEYYQNQILAIQQGRNQLSHRFKAKKELNAEDTLHYYSQWYFAYIHIIVSIPRYQNFEALLKITKLSEKKLREVISFLKQTQLIEESNNRFKMGEARLHLSGQHPLISRHHAHWRMQAIKSLEDPAKEDLHYSSVVSLSREDAENLRSEFVNMLEKYNRVVAISKEEECHSLVFDFFRQDR